MALGQFVISGQVKNLKMPVVIIQGLVNVTEIKLFEKLVLNLDLSGYQEHISHLHSICERCEFHSALFYISMVMLDNRDKQEYTCEQYLKLALEFKEKARQSELDTQDAKVKRDQLQQLKEVDDAKRAQIEKSHFYIGYKILWTMQLLIQGIKFPNSRFSDSQQTAFVLDIVKIIHNEEYLK